MWKRYSLTSHSHAQAFTHLALSLYSPQTAVALSNSSHRTPIASFIAATKRTHFSHVIHRFTWTVFWSGLNLVWILITSYPALQDEDTSGSVNFQYSSYSPIALAIIPQPRFTMLLTFCTYSPQEDFTLSWTTDTRWSLSLHYPPSRRFTRSQEDKLFRCSEIDWYRRLSTELSLQAISQRYCCSMNSYISSQHML